MLVLVGHHLDRIGRNARVCGQVGRCHQLTNAAAGDDGPPHCRWRAVLKSGRMLTHQRRLLCPRDLRLEQLASCRPGHQSGGGSCDSGAPRAQEGTLRVLRPPACCEAAASRRSDKERHHANLGPRRAPSSTAASATVALSAVTQQRQAETKWAPLGIAPRAPSTSRAAPVRAARAHHCAKARQRAGAAWRSRMEGLSPAVWRDYIDVGMARPVLPRFNESFCKISMGANEHYKALVPAPPFSDQGAGAGPGHVDWKFSGAVAVGTNVFFTPSYSNEIGVLDTVTSSFDYIVTGLPPWGWEYDKWIGAAAVGSMVYFAPYTFNSVGILDTVSHEFSMLQLPLGDGVGDGDVLSKYYGATAIESSIYFTPFNGRCCKSNRAPTHPILLTNSSDARPGAGQLTTLACLRPSPVDSR